MMASLKDHSVYNGPKVIESLEDRVAFIEFFDNGIIYFKLKENVEIQVEDSDNHLRLLESRYDGITKFKVMVEAGENSTITKEAREYGSLDERNKLTAKTAVIVKSLAHRLIMNFFIKVIRQQGGKMKIFENKEEAIEWLLAL